MIVKRFVFQGFVIVVKRAVVGGLILTSMHVEPCPVEEPADNSPFVVQPVALPKSPHGHDNDSTPLPLNQTRIGLQASTASTPSGSTLAIQLW